jgi:hypothetical protein
MTDEKKTIRPLLDQIAERRDEIRVQLHLAGMDLKEDWDRLEEKLRGIAKLEELEDQAKLRAHLAKMEAQDEMRAMGKTLDAVVDGINRHSNEISEEVKDAVEALRKRIGSYRERYKKSA